MEIRCSILNSSKTMILAMPRTWLVRIRQSWQKYIQFRKVSKIKLARAKTKLISKLLRNEIDYNSLTS